MKGNAEVLAGLNEALAEELTAINQYFIHAEMCENWGYEKLATAFKKQSIDEMKHAEALIERLLFLEGIPGMEPAKAINVGAEVPAMIKNDLALENGAVAMYNRLAATAARNNDRVSEELFKKILKDEEAHVDASEEKLDQIGQMGVQIYLSVQV